MTGRPPLLAALLVVLAATALGDPDGWTLAARENGVEVYTRSVPDSALAEFRATAVVPAPVSEVVGWWRDASTFTHWIARCREARAVGESGDAVYLRFDFPFPAADRDVVLRAHRLEDSGGAVAYENEIADGLVPEVAGVVRVPHFRSRWEFHASGERATRVVYRQHMDPGGVLPAFIVNKATVDNPLETLQGLARFAEANRSGR